MKVNTKKMVNIKLKDGQDIDGGQYGVREGDQYRDSNDCNKVLSYLALQLGIPNVKPILSLKVQYGFQSHVTSTFS